MLKLEIHNQSDVISKLDVKVRADSLAAVHSRLAAGEYGFVNALGNEKQLDSLKDLLERVSDFADTLLVVGIGGSDLGARAIAQALGERAHWQVLFAGDTTDPYLLEEILEHIDWSRTIVNVVSKSGNTLEIVSTYAVCRKLAEDALGEGWNNHFIFTTDDDSGAFHAEAEKFDVAQVIVPDEVGGRFSVLTTVGLLSALALGADASKLLEGGRTAVERFISENGNSLPAQIAFYQLAQLENYDRNLSVLMPYSNRLNEFARWYRQLWAESLGKNGKGIMPIQSFGPADQHSQLQFYMQGADLATYTFLKVEDHEASLLVPKIDFSGDNHAAGLDLADVINVQQQAAREALVEVGRPCATLSLEKVDEAHLGELFVTFELAVVLLAELLRVNAFDQPGVELAKQKALARLDNLGKLGTE